MKILTDFRKTVKTGVDPRLSLKKRKKNKRISYYNRRH